jgi:Fibronectin type III domain./Putative peptidoglycan binding domain.
LVAGFGALSTSPASAVLTSAPQNVKVAFAGSSSAAEVTWDAPQVVSGVGVASYQIVLDGYGDATSTTPVYEKSATEPGTGLAHKFTAVPPGVFLQAHVKAVTTGTGTVSDDGASSRIPAYSPTPGPTNASHSKVATGGNTTIRWKASKKVANAPVTGYRVTVEGWKRIVKGTSVKIKGFRQGTHRVKIVALSKNGNSKPTVVLVKVNKAHATPHKATLQLGSHGRAVKKLREALNVKQKGHSNYFGRSTRRAVVKYQKKHHKAVTGRVNDQMRFALTV